MRSFLPVLLAATAFLTSPASAAVLGASNVTLGSTPTTINLGGSSFSFSYDSVAAASFNSPYSVQTTGTAQTSAFFGQPSPFDQRGITIDGNLFPSFAAIPTSTIIPYSIVAEDLALRYSVGSDFFYGYARLNGNSTFDYAFESVANTAITAGAAATGSLVSAAPEPSTWAMFILGFGVAGYSLRRRRSTGKMFNQVVA